MVYNFTASAKIYRIKAWRFGLYFVLLDILYVPPPSPLPSFVCILLTPLNHSAFLIQAGGAAIASGDTKDLDKVRLGLRVYQAGVGVQQLFIFLFLALVIGFHRQFKREAPNHRTSAAMWLLYVIYMVLFLITLRIIFRLVEFASGLDSSIPNHEAYQYCLDSLPMWIALVLFNVVHPGRIMPGKEGDFPPRRERKTFAGRRGVDRSFGIEMEPGDGFTGAGRGEKAVVGKR